MIIVHRLLKNTVPAKEYILLTESAYRDVQFPGEETYDDLGKINTFYPPAAAGAVQSPDQKQYSSIFYRWKNLARKILRSKLLDHGWVKLPKFNNLPDGIEKS